MQYAVLPYTPSNLAKVLAWKVSVKAIKKKTHYSYFLEYFSDEGLSAKTILVEENYISRAYFSDFSNYYSTCFKDYPRFCRRLHFFDKSFDAKKFREVLFDLKTSFLADSYLGYIVVKPLPESIIGPTILRTYGNTAKSRLYNSCRSYEINVFGRNFKLESLAYQEQDTVVSACASTAIWNAFHKTSDMFQTELPSPSEITKSAGNFYNHSGRIFPNQGLDLSQICKAIESVGLVSELRVEGRIEETEQGRQEIIRSDIPYARRIVYAYNKAGLPVLLFIQIDNNGHHLITVNGFSEKDEVFKKTEEMTLKADRIERFYVHDDQVGPFARITIENSTSLKTAWKEAGQLLSGKIYAIIIPLYPKIRISFDDVYKKIRILDIILYRLDIFKFELEWDIYLTESNQYKDETLKSNYDQTLKDRIVFGNHPRYIWIARAIVKKNIVFDLIFDSTDISRGPFCKDFILYEPAAKPQLRKAFLNRKDIIFDDGSPLNFGKNLYKVIKEALS